MWGGGAKDAMPMIGGLNRPRPPIAPKPTTALKAVTQPNGMKVEYHPPKPKPIFGKDGGFFSKSSMTGGSKAGKL
jgi:hypothetical protein